MSFRRRGRRAAQTAEAQPSPATTQPQPQPQSQPAPQRSRPQRQLPASSKPASSPSSKPRSNYAFIDSQNLNLGTQRMGWKLDWRKFREFLATQHGVTHAYMFIGYMSENEQLYEYMHELGYLVVLKPTVDVTPTADPTQKAAADNKDQPAAGKGKPAESKAKPAADKEKPTVKGNVDADLVLHAMKELPHYDQAIIVSGDGDFLGLIEYLQEQGKLAHIMTPNWQYSSLFKPYEPHIIRLDQLRRQLAYHDRKKK